MINGAHAVIYSADAEGPGRPWAKVLGTRSVDAGGGWLIFTLRLSSSPSIRRTQAAGRFVPAVRRGRHRGPQAEG